MFAKFLRALRKHLKETYPFVMTMKESFDAALPKDRSFYLGLSPVFNKHVILNFHHATKSWRAGEVTIFVHISSEFKAGGNWNAGQNEFKKFDDCLVSLSVGLTGKSKTWCLKSNESMSTNATEYWRPNSYESEGETIREAIEDMSPMLEDLFRFAGFIERAR